MIGIIDCGRSNVTSVKNAVYEVGFDYQLIGSSDFEKINDLTHLILPGVGSFGAISECLHKDGYVDFIHSWVKKNKPFLGICLGMQLLFDGSAESPGVPGLGILPGVVEALPATDGNRVPHVGWNELEIIEKNTLVSGIVNDCDMYFVHSYFCPVGSYTVAKTKYVEEFSSILRKGNVCGMQFHPEKSQKNGLRLLENFLEI